MRSLLFGLMLLLGSQSASGQDQVKTWIFLTDKIDYMGKHTVAAPDQISAKAQQRMELRGNPLKARQIARQDAPVAVRYTEALSNLGVDIIHTSRWLNAVTAWLTEDELSLVASLPFVRETRPVAHMTTLVEPYEPVPLSFAPRQSRICTGSTVYGASCDQLDVVNAIPVLERGVNGAGVHIGFVDTKFGSTTPFSHRAFQHIQDSGRIGGHEDFTNRDATQPCNQGNLHGQAVSSVTVGYIEREQIGPAHGATVWGAVTECAPYERNIEEDNFVAGTEWLVDQGVDIINSSLGYTTFDSGQHSYTVDDLDGNTGITTRIFDWAVGRGVVTVSSAGNSGSDPFWRYISTPADGDSVIAAGGVYYNGSYWPVSSRGPTADGRIKPDVSAQAADVFVASGSSGFGYSNGTSFSAPMITGVIAQILQENAALNPREVWELLKSTASLSMNPNNRLGWGIVDADAAVQAAVVLNIESHDSPKHPDNIAHTLYPNPFRDATTLKMSLAQPASDARLMLYDLIGREVARPFAGHLGAGSHEIEINAGRLTPGMYLYVIETGQSRDTGTLIVLR